MDQAHLYGQEMTHLKVPIEPTQEMLDEGEFAIRHNGPDPYFIWIHMLNAWQYSNFMAGRMDIRFWKGDLIVPIRPSQAMLDEGEFAVRWNGPDQYLVWSSMITACESIHG